MIIIIIVTIIVVAVATLVPKGPLEILQNMEVQINCTIGKFFLRVKSQ